MIMALQVDINKKYDDFVLDTAFLSSSKRIGILGASGCGKSLTLKSIAGLIRPDRGRIVFDDIVLFDSGTGTDIKPGKRNVGYLFQNYALFPNMSVEENIRTALRASGRNNRDVDKILERFGLIYVRKHKPHELSGGQQQRTALARMMAADPMLMLLDEPFSAMDTHLREGLRLELIRMLDNYDKTVILVSHDRDEVYQMCEETVLMDKGRVIAYGKTDGLFLEPGSVAAARLTGCKNISRIRKTDRHRAEALDWQGIELCTEGEVTDDITHVGIRAHDLMPGDHGVNVVRTGKVMISALPFEWYVTLENGLWWKVKKELYDNDKVLAVPEFMSIDPKRIMLLKDIK